MRLTASMSDGGPGLLLRKIGLPSSKLVISGRRRRVAERDGQMMRIPASIEKIEFNLSLFGR